MKFKLLLANIFLSAVRCGIVLLASIVMFILGVFIHVCSDIALALLVFYIILVAFFTVRAQMRLSYRSNDNPEFNEMMDALTNDPESFLKEKMEENEERANLHGEELLVLDDDELYETVYMRCVDEYEDEALDQIKGAHRVVYILSWFDMEIQNGGLCQFFVNSSSVVAPHVSKCLDTVGAYRHKELWEKFTRDNNIDLNNLDSFMIFSHRGYLKQTKRFDFDSFDDAYYDLPPLQAILTEYIRNNINEF